MMKFITPEQTSEQLVSFYLSEQTELFNCFLGGNQYTYQGNQFQKVTANVGAI